MDVEDERATARAPEVVLRVCGGKVAEDGDWVYVWKSDSDQRVVHVGGTFLAPLVRTWLHLNDSRPSVGHIAANYTVEPDERLDVLAFRVTEDRGVVRRALAAALREADLLSARYAGEVPAPAPGDPQLGVQDIVEAVRCHTVE